MARQTTAQKETVHRVTHEFKEGELKIRGSGFKVKNPKQAIAIALHEAGASNQESPSKNRENLRKTKTKERKGQTASVAKNAASPRERLASKASKVARVRTRAELYAEAKRRDILGRSKMSKEQLERALR
jgi:hypothetical protein